MKALPSFVIYRLRQNRFRTKIQQKDLPWLRPHKIKLKTNQYRTENKFKLTQIHLIFSINFNSIKFPLNSHISKAQKSIKSIMNNSHLNPAKIPSKFALSLEKNLKNKEVLSQQYLLPEKFLLSPIFDLQNFSCKALLGHLKFIKKNCVENGKRVSLEEQKSFLFLLLRTSCFMYLLFINDNMKTFLGPLPCR